MPRYDPNKHHRRSIRMRGHDYTQPGAYFVTIVAHERETLFNDPVLRRVAETMWQRIPQHFANVELGEWVVMPDHIHGVIMISSSRSEASPNRCFSTAGGSAHVPPIGPPAGSLGAIVGTFKAVTARRINQIRKTPGAPVWQRNYYEHIIRDEREMDAISQYIRDNPIRWAGDPAWGEASPEPGFPAQGLWGDSRHAAPSRVG